MQSGRAMAAAVKLSCLEGPVVGLPEALAPACCGPKPLPAALLHVQGGAFTVSSAEAILEALG